MRITKLVDGPFLKCWWDMVIVLFRARIELGLIAVEGHLALWRNGVYHRDVSASNLMYKDEGGKVVGVQHGPIYGVKTARRRRRNQTHLCA
ncbi:hypothetical protein V8E55_009553 [Tylopilus felleus]